MYKRGNFIHGDMITHTRNNGLISSYVITLNIYMKYSFNVKPTYFEEYS